MVMGWIALALCVSGPVHAKPQGPGDGGGGDDVGLQFQAAIQSAVEIVHVGGSDFAPLSRLDWDKITKDVKVLAVDEKLYVVLQGVKQEVVALNFPDTRLIQVNRDRWKGILEERVREGIALHEVLSIAKLESTGSYPLSGLFLSLFHYVPDPILGGSGQPAKPPGLAPRPSEISAIYPYHCKNRYLQGEGVSAFQVACVPGQRLGFLLADHTFYVYSNPTHSNMSAASSQRNFPSGICGLEQVPEFTCDQPNEAAFGLSRAAEGPYVVGITMTPGPSGQSESYGYAALPDSSGNCPANLVKARPWVAVPPSIVDPLPSSFLNTSGTLNDTQVAVDQPKSFEVWRVPGGTPCDATGNCSAWSPGGRERVESVAYVPETPIVCVIPKEAL